MKLLLFSSTTYNIDLFEDACMKSDVDFININPIKDMSITFNGNLCEITTNGITSSFDKNETLCISDVQRPINKFPVILKQLEENGFLVGNTIDTVEISNDKAKTIEKFEEANCPYPKSLILTESNIDDFDTLVDEMEFTFPVIVKTSKGSRGDEVFIFHHKECLKCIAKYLIKNSNNLGFNSIIVQERIEADSDFRVNVFRKSKSATFTSNDEYIVVSAIKRNKKQGEYRTSTSLGSQLENATPSENVKNAAIQAAKSVKSVWCGVDVICDSNGNAYALEMNYIPSIRKMMEYAETNPILTFVQNMKEAFSTNS